MLTFLENFFLMKATAMNTVRYLPLKILLCKLKQSWKEICDWRTEGGVATISQNKDTSDKNHTDARISLVFQDDDSHDKLFWLFSCWIWGEKCQSPKGGVSINFTNLESNILTTKHLPPTYPKANIQYQSFHYGWLAKLVPNYQSLHSVSIIFHLSQKSVIWSMTAFHVKKIWRNDY